MIDKKSEPQLYKILELIEQAARKCYSLIEVLNSGSATDADLDFETVAADIEAFKEEQKSHEFQFEQSSLPEMFENIDDTVNVIREKLKSGDLAGAGQKAEFQLLPFLRLLWETFYFRGLIYPNGQKMAQYYRDEYADHYRNIYIERPDFPKYKLTIAISGYNHIDYTKKCVEQFLRRTDLKKLNAELLLIDHGSDDGTLEYFESLKIGKIIRCKKNIRMNLFALIAQISLSEYFCFVSNDILVTKNWANILLSCMESDEDIICAVPALPNISNLQTYEVPDNLPQNPKEYMAWANDHNRSNPALWDERARLMPAIAMYNTKAVSKVGFGDPYYYYLEFWDDDFSLRARRAGYKQILCKDVACWHFGSVTGKEAQKKENTLDIGREMFIKKNKSDPWGNGFCYNPRTINIFKENLNSPGEAAFLGIDCGFGDTPLQFRNEMRKKQRTCKLYSLTTQREYEADLSEIADYSAFAFDLEKGIDENFNDEKFQAVYIERDISEYKNYNAIFGGISNKMSVGGLLVFTCGNPFFLIHTNGFLNFAFPGAERISYANPNVIEQICRKYFSEVLRLPITAEINGINEYVALHYPNSADKEGIKKLLSEQLYYFICRK